MESSSPPTLSGHRRWEILCEVLVWVGVLALGARYVAFLAGHVGATAGGSDSSGYLNHARLLASGTLHVAPRVLPGLNAAHFSEYLYVPLGFLPEHGWLVPSYPGGLPLFIVAAVPLVGWAHAADLVIVAHAIAGLGLLFALGRLLGIDWRWCLVGVVTAALSPLYMMFSLQAMSDVPAAVWTLAAAYAAWRSRGRPLWALFAGVCFGVSVLIRPNNAILALPLVVAWWPAADESRRWKRAAVRALLFVAGGLPAGVFFCLHSHAAYGSYLATGYGDAGALFQEGMIGITLKHYLQWLPVEFSPAVFLVLGLPWARRAGGRVALFLGTWIFAYLAFYVSYYHTHEAWWYLRFLLPAGAALILGWLWVAQAMWNRWSGRTRPYLLVAIALAVMLGKYELKWDRLLGTSETGDEEHTYALLVDWLNAHAPADSVLMAMQASGAAYFDSGFIIIRWDQMDPAHFREVTAAAAADHRPIYAPLFPFEAPALHERMPGLWQQVGQVRDVTIWRWAGGGAAR